MGSTGRRRLAIKKQTLRKLGATQLADVVGGADVGPGDQAPSVEGTCVYDRPRDPTIGTVDPAR